MHFRRKSDGFTLIEIMMAIGILVIGMTGVLALYAVAVDAHRRAMDNSGMAFLAESMLSEITADFTKREVDGDGTATFIESFIDLSCRFKRMAETPPGSGSYEYRWQEGVEAPNSPGFNCEVSIYPLPRRLWLEPDLDFQPVPDDMAARIETTIEDTDARLRATEEYQFDAWMMAQYWDAGTGDLVLPTNPDDDPLPPLLARALEYKLVVRIIRGGGEQNDIETFRTIILPGSVVEQTD